MTQAGRTSEPCRSVPMAAPACCSAPTARCRPGRRRISIDCATALIAHWDKIVAVFQALPNQEHEAKSFMRCGDFAGGDVAVSTVLNLRAR